MYVYRAVDKLVCISTHLTCKSSMHMHAKEEVLHLSHSIGYTARRPGIWSGLAGWRAAWRWRGGTRWASAAGKLPASRSHGHGTQTPYSAERRGGWGGRRGAADSVGLAWHLVAARRNCSLIRKDGACYIIKWHWIRVGECHLTLEESYIRKVNSSCRSISSMERVNILFYSTCYSCHRGNMEIFLPVRRKGTFFRRSQLWRIRVLVFAGPWSCHRERLPSSSRGDNGRIIGKHYVTKRSVISQQHLWMKQNFMSICSIFCYCGKLTLILLKFL